ncbi:MAG: polymorphic toxin type 50 domain-containing protein, partial [Methylobacterium sp.]|uniref:polymorphic toxin type 50 domain-containing protein n=1 Tax=Methylobacterium sp. TaxID=409 RepID=UPI00272894CB
LNVLAGASYCEDTGGASGCFLKGQALNYLSEAVITAAYVSLGLRSAIENGKIGGAALGGGFAKPTLGNAGKGIVNPNGLPTNIHMGQQGKHIRGHNNFQEGRSYFNDGVDPTELLAGVHSGKYPVIGTGKRGNPIVDFGRPIGVDGATGQSVTRGQIRYGRNGAHIVPDARN